MKKILVLLCILFLCACSNEYTKLGYSQKEANLIKSLSASSQTFFSTYNEELASLLDEKDFIKNNFDNYYLYIKYLDSANVVYLVNNNILSSDK